MVPSIPHPQYFLLTTLFIFPIASYFFALYKIQTRDCEIREKFYDWNTREISFSTRQSTAATRDQRWSQYFKNHKVSLDIYETFHVELISISDWQSVHRHFFSHVFQLSENHSKFPTEAKMAIDTVTLNHFYKNHAGKLLNNSLKNFRPPWTKARAVPNRKTNFSNKYFTAVYYVLRPLNVNYAYMFEIKLSISQFKNLRLSQSA